MKQNFNSEIWLVERLEFDPEQWLTEPADKKTSKSSPKDIFLLSSKKSMLKTQYEIEVIIRRIEYYKIDLTANYNDWLNIGFALADEFGESGEDYFHRLSAYNSLYKYDKCKNQFEKCLKNNKKGITIKTLFYLAQQAGINIKV